MAVPLYWLELPPKPEDMDDDTWYACQALLIIDAKPIGADDGFMLKQGDLVAVEALFTGAGEFEGLRVVGKPRDGLLPLVSMGIEYPEFPLQTTELYGSVEKLREAYAAPFDKMLDQTCGMMLEDVCDDLDTFWKDSRKGVEASPKSSHEWNIKLSECSLKEGPVNM